MPKGRKIGSTLNRHIGAMTGLVMMLSGCGGLEMPSMLRMGDHPSAPAAASFAPQGAASALIADLQARRSVLPVGGPFAQVADAVLAADAGAAAAELRVARLKAEARSKNWLPQIGPQVSLTSLSGLVAGLLVEQALFDNGRRKAERAFAAADVEVAAVGLSAAINQRVYEGLVYYVNAERARAQAAVAGKGAARLAEFENIMAQRVEGGLSDRSEQQVLQQRTAEMQATLASDRQAEASAMAELTALTGQPMGHVQGMESLAAGPAPEPLSVVRMRGEGARAIAQARAERAGMLPGLAATAGIGSDGVNPGLAMTGAGLLNPGAGAAMAALDQTADVIDRQIATAAETANRRVVALESQIATLSTRQAQGAEVLRQTAGNLELFTEQYKVGRRSLLELVSQYDAYARLERDQASLRYDIALLQLEIARDRGLLVDGARM